MRVGWLVRSRALAGVSYAGWRGRASSSSFLKAASFAVWHSQTVKTR